MIDRECRRILDGLIVDEQGELTLDGALRNHLDECPGCRVIYDRIQQAKAERVPHYVSRVMQRLEEECLQLLEGLVVDEKGELILEADYQRHLDECQHCRDVYERIQAAKLLEVPRYVPGVMREIRTMEMPTSARGWPKSLMGLFTFPGVFRPRVLLPSLATLILMVFLALNFGTRMFSGKSHSDEYVNLASVDRNEALGRFFDSDKRLSIALDRHLSDQIGLLQDDL